MDMFKDKFENAKRYFDRKLPYWCDSFSRPYDERFSDSINNNGCNVHYWVSEAFDPVYAPIDMDFNLVRATAKERAKLRNEGVEEDELPILL